MSVANAITSAVFIGILVFPLTTFVSAIVLGNEPFSSLMLLTWYQVGLFAILYFCPLIVARYAKEFAMNLYDEIDESKKS
jgi:Kef-type K+ transport system membrane component KefB